MKGINCFSPVILEVTYIKTDLLHPQVRKAIASLIFFFIFKLESQL